MLLRTGFLSNNWIGWIADGSLYHYRSEEDIQEVSKFAHLLRGSSETLGLLKVQTGCEKLQHYGNNEDLDGSPEPDSELCLKRIVETLKDVKADYADVKMVLENFYKDL